MAKPSKLAHVVYMTRRYEEMLAWYQKVFEAKVQYQNPAFAFLTYDEEHHRFAFANTMYYRDPDGNRMEFQVDCCRNADEAHAFMHSEAFAANPVGVDIDADALLAQYRNGASEDSLLAMPTGKPTQIPPEHGLL